MSLTDFQNDLPLRYFFRLFECFYFDVGDDEVICLEPKKTEGKRTVGRLRKHHKLKNCELDINELHDFNDIL